MVLNEKCPLFRGIDSNNIKSVLKCLNSKEKNYSKNEYIYYCGDHIKMIGIVMSGKVQIMKEDVWGNNVILAELGEGMLFGEAFVLSGISKIPLSVKACENTTALFIDKDKVMTPCSSACDFHMDISKNLIKILASKNVFLTERLEHISKRTLKDKVLSYLSSEASKSGSLIFEIPFNRQELADYLSSDRSALSAVLSNLKSEGIIDYHKNKFKLNE